MTRVANVFVVGAVAVLVAAAGFDAIRGSHHHESATARALAAAHVSGTLYLVDARCRLRALRLPSLRPVAAPRARACSVAVAPRRLTSASWSLWRPGARLVAYCRGGRVLVRAERGPTLPFIVGCAPAWSPTGALTLVRHGSVVQFVPHGRAEVVVPARGVREVTWLGRRLVVLGRGKITVLGGAVSVAERTVASSFHDLRASPRGTRLTVRAGGRVVVFDPRLVVRRIVRARAVAWSPDERDLAIARPGGIRIERDGRLVATIPIAARDVAWPLDP